MLQEKTGMAKEKLDGHHQKRFEGHGHYLGKSQKTDVPINKSSISGTFVPWNFHSQE